MLTNGGVFSEKELCVLAGRPGGSIFQGQQEYSDRNVTMVPRGTPVFRADEELINFIFCHIKGLIVRSVES